MNAPRIGVLFLATLLARDIGHGRLRALAAADLDFDDDGQRAGVCRGDDVHENEPVVVAAEDGRYRVVDGWGRALRATMRGSTTIPCFVLDAAAEPDETEADDGADDAGRALSPSSRQSEPAGETEGLTKTLRLALIEAIDKGLRKATGHGCGTSGSLSEAAVLAVARRPDWAEHPARVASGIAGLDFDDVKRVATARAETDDRSVVSHMADLIGLSIQRSINRQAVPRPTVVALDIKPVKPAPFLAGTRDRTKPSDAAVRVAKRAGIRIRTDLPITGLAPKGSTTAVAALNRLAEMGEDGATAILLGLGSNPSGTASNVSARMLLATVSMLRQDTSLAGHPGLATAIVAVDIPALRAQTRRTTGTSHAKLGSALKAAIQGKMGFDDRAASPGRPAGDIVSPAL